MNKMERTSTQSIRTLGPKILDRLIGDHHPMSCPNFSLNGGECDSVALTNCVNLIDAGTRERRIDYRDCPKFYTGDNKK